MTTTQKTLTGAQIAAARALIGWKQCDLAEAAGVHRNTVCALEAAEALRHEAGAVARILEALGAQGVAFVKGGAALRKAA